MGDVHRGEAVRVDVSEAKAALIEHIKRKKRSRTMKALTIGNGKLTTIGAIITSIGLVASQFGFAEEVEEIKAIALTLEESGLIMMIAGLARKLAKKFGWLPSE